MTANCWSFVLNKDLKRKSGSSSSKPGLFYRRSLCSKSWQYSFHCLNYKTYFLFAIVQACCFPLAKSSNIHVLREHVLSSWFHMQLMYHIRGLAQNSDSDAFNLQNFQWWIILTCKWFSLYYFFFKFFLKWTFYAKSNFPQPHILLQMLYMFRTVPPSLMSLLKTPMCGCHPGQGYLTVVLFYAPLLCIVYLWNVIWQWCFKIGCTKPGRSYVRTDYFLNEFFSFVFSQKTQAKKSHRKVHLCNWPGKSLIFFIFSCLCCPQVVRRSKDLGWLELWEHKQILGGLLISYPILSQTSFLIFSVDIDFICILEDFLYPFGIQKFKFSKSKYEDLNGRWVTVTVKKNRLQMMPTS